MYLTKNFSILINHVSELVNKNILTNLKNFHGFYSQISIQFETANNLSDPQFYKWKTSFFTRDAPVEQLHCNFLSAGNFDITVLRKEITSPMQCILNEYVFYFTF